MPYLIQELSLYMLKRVRRAANWGQSETFARLNFYDIERELRGQNVAMARAKQKRTDNSNGTVQAGKNQVAWTNYRLNSEDTPIVLDDANNIEELAARLARLFGSGVDFSVRYVPERKNYSAFAISLPGDDTTQRVGISAFGGTIWQAIAAVLYKCDLYESSPEDFTQSGQNLGIG